MSKHDKTPNDPRATQVSWKATHDWQSQFDRLIDDVDGALDIATAFSRDQEELDSIGHVHDFVHGWLEGRHVAVPLADALKAIALVIGLLELDLGSDAVPLLGPLRAVLELPPPISALYCPGAGDDNPPTSIRRFPSRRSTSTSVPNPFAS